MSRLATRLREAFAQLSPEVPLDLKAMALPEAPGLPAGVSIALDTDARRHVLVPLADPVRPVSPDRTSSGIQLTAQVWLEGDQPRRYLDIVCLKVHLADLFCEVVAEMLSAMGDAAERPERAASRVLARWRELLGRPPSSRPESAVLQGLLGELSVLRWVAERGGPEALARWTGPLGEIHDFRGPSGAIEVKTTGRQGWRVAVHGIEQLAPPANGPLHLVVFQLEPEEDGTTASDLVEALVALGIDRVALLERLARAGVGADQLGIDDEDAWRIRECRIFPITPDFPQIVASSFVSGGLPPGVTHVDYGIDLTAWTGPTLDPEAAEALWLRWATA